MGLFYRYHLRIYPSQLFDNPRYIFILCYFENSWLLCNGASTKQLIINRESNTKKIFSYLNLQLNSSSELTELLECQPFRPYKRKILKFYWKLGYSMRCIIDLLRYRSRLIPLLYNYNELLLIKNYSIITIFLYLEINFMIFSQFILLI